MKAAPQVSPYLLVSRSFPTARKIPLALAMIAAIAHVLTHGGLYYPDMTNTLREGWMLGSPTAYPIIPPAHPLILDVISLFFQAQARMFALVVLQHAAVVGSVWCVLRIVERANHPRLAIVAASVVALYAPLYAFAQTSQSESLFVLFALIATGLTIRSWSSSATRASAPGAGASVALAMAQRTVGVALVPAIVWTLVVGRVDGKWRLTGKIAAGFAVVIALFVVNNRILHGFTGLVGGSGIHLFGRLAVVDRRLPDTDDSRRLLDIARRHGIENVFFPQAGFHLQTVLAWREGMGPAAADALLRKVVLQSWQADPVQTATDTVRSMTVIAGGSKWSGRVTLGGLGRDGFVKHLQITDAIWAADLPLLTRIRNQFPPYPPPLLIGPGIYRMFYAWSDVASMLSGVWVVPTIVVAGVIGMWRRHEVLLLTAGMAFSQLALAAFGDQPVTRTWHPVVPFFVMSVSLAIAELTRQRGGSSLVISEP